MRRAVIVHCWGGMPEYCWYQWAKQQLEAKGFSVEVPAMPETDEPKLSLWLPKLQAVVGQPDEGLYLIGHSIGCAAIMRYLEQLPAGAKIGGIVLVAGFTDDLGFDELTNFYQTPLDFAAIRSRLAHGSILIHSDNDQYVPVRYSPLLQGKLAAREALMLHDKGHFSGAIDDEKSCTKLPELVTAITKLAG